MKKSILVLSALSLVIYSITFAESKVSPSFCQVSNLKKLKVSAKTSGVSRLNVFKMGQIYVAGLAVGNSKAASVKKLAAEFSNATATNQYCTWYFNNGNSEAEHSFNWHDLPRPSGSNYSKMVGVYSDELMDQFFTSPNSFVNCAINQKYIAMGCNGMKHRGPSVFAMLLSFAGCQPQESVTIVNSLWGENGITPEMRKALAQWAFDFGVSHPETSTQLRSLLEASTQ